MTPWQVLLEALGGEVKDRLDGDILPSLYAAVSVPTATIRADLRDDGLRFIDSDTGQWPTEQELDESAKRATVASQRRGAGLGIASGIVGAVAIPPEVLAGLVLALRLGQRLAVIYGFDPETDAGRLVLWRAIAAAYDIELPQQAQVGMRVRDLPELLKSQLPASQQAATWMARQVAVRALMTGVSRVTRLIPGLGAGVAGYSAHRRIDAMAKRMLTVFKRSVEARPFDLLDESLAVEVRSTE